MSVQKKSLISSQSKENKTTTQPVRETAAIGASKGLTANALAQHSFKHKRGGAGIAVKELRNVGGLMIRAAKKKR